MNIILLIAMTIILISCNQSEEKLQRNTAQSSISAYVSPTWEYSEHIDKMRKQKSWTAILTSMNQPQLKFPYEGGSPVYLSLFKEAGDSPDNYAPKLVLENGQFDCSLYGGTTSCLITVKADENEPIDLRGISGKCGSAECMSLADERAIENGGPVYGPVYDMIRNSKRLTVELPLYDYGSYQFEFNTADLQWARETNRQ